MVKKRPKPRGNLVVDRAIQPIHIQALRNLGWNVKNISIKDRDLKDTPLSEKYGLGRNILLTRDQSYYQNNSKEQGKGFIGYIIVMQVKPKELQTYNEKFIKDLQNLTSKNISGNNLIVHKVKKATKIP